MVRLTTGKSRDKPRLKPRITRNINPIYARLLKIAKRTGLPKYYQRDLVVDRMSINRNHPSAIIVGLRETGTQLVCLARGKRKSKDVNSWLKINISRIEYPAKHQWYYITASGGRQISKEEAIGILIKHAEKQVK
jgi:hypothetical protein